MATITPTLTITANSSGAAAAEGPISTSISLSATDTLTVDTVEGQIFTIGTGANTVILDGSALETAFTPGTNGCFIYLKNTMTTGTETICIGIGADNLNPAVDNGTTDLTRAHTDSARTFALKAGEFAFFPFDYCGDIVAQATAASQTLEYMRFDRG
mgnify:FL=1